MGCGTSFVKYVLFIFNLLVAMFGLLLLGLGVAFLLHWKVVINQMSNVMSVAPMLFCVLGGVTFVIAFFGCCGAIRESHCMVVTYAIFLLVIIILQVIGAVLLFIYGDSIKASINNGVSSLFDKRASGDADNVVKTVVDNIQIQFQCCGKDGPTDMGIVDLPPSCCVNKNEASTASRLLGTCIAADANPGCAPTIAELFKKWNKPFAGITIGIACVEVVGALFALCLANSIRNMDRRSHY